MKSSVIKKLRK